MRCYFGQSSVGTSLGLLSIVERGQGQFVRMWVQVHDYVKSRCDQSVSGSVMKQECC